jgi:hypothetical protein
MPFDWPQHLRETAERLVNLSERTGWTDYARQLRNDLFADPTWSGLKEEIQRVRKERRDAQSGTS